MILFPEPAIDTGADQGCCTVEAKCNARFPCIYKKESVDFH